MSLKHIGYVLRNDNGALWCEVEESIEGWALLPANDYMDKVLVFSDLASARNTRDNYVKSGHIHEVFVDESEYTDLRSSRPSEESSGQG